MNIVPYDSSKLNYRKRGANQAIIEEFYNSELDCVKLTGWTHKSARTCQSNMVSSIKRMGLNNSIKVVKRNNDVFLLRVSE